MTWISKSRAEPTIKPSECEEFGDVATAGRERQVVGVPERTDDDAETAAEIADGGAGGGVDTELDAVRLAHTAALLLRNGKPAAAKELDFDRQAAEFLKHRAQVRRIAIACGKKAGEAQDEIVIDAASFAQAFGTETGQGKEGRDEGIVLAVAAPAQPACEAIFLAGLDEQLGHAGAEKIEEACQSLRPVALFAKDDFVISGWHGAERADQAGKRALDRSAHAAPLEAVDRERRGRDADMG
jgi:hypothetical protein